MKYMCEWITWGCMVCVFLAYVITGGSGMSQLLTLVFTACLALSTI